ncbi:PAS domain S-box protein [Bradyrhizobium sp. AUGA SZCCT0240]|jgi:PAS domain S-box-containing protein|uniref:PAS domain S-box protein n=1 Tax=unclassified Bradyrhizobium TaxID=2631580 RepID=UPI001BAAD524|nr:MULTISPECIES: PAS domain S-box protein [unclassified Bradyrhizobium]MBR1200908.1 PAS domain S-box protein [Bradyrhizobium sp. AUGA SZCCT0158]MBR1251244.1 PAS domain S-box protein [Bradyrhizobium sp. AUGA SZCCT0169]MBR1258770.1 PAS domain S-box protein [Bradyrhizobium sp. AUGA SZCCT0240]
MTLTTRLAIAMIALVALAVSAVGWLSYRNLEQALLLRARDRIETHSRQVATDLEYHAASATGDVAGFRSAAALHGLVRARRAGGIDPVDGVSEKTWRDRIATRFAAELEAKPTYAMLRIFSYDDDGREIVRVDRMGPNDTVRIVPEEGLQKRSNRNYFTETLALGPGQIYVSPLDLGRRDGLIEERHRPTIRIATPVFADDGKLFGIFMINVDMRRAFDRVRSSVLPGETIYLVNRQGDYLIHPDRSREFGTLLGTPNDWKADFPQLAAQAGATRGVAEIIPDHAARSGGIALAPVLLAGTEWVGVIETTPNAVIMAPAASIRNTSLLVGTIAVLCAAVLALLIARSLTRPIVRLTAAVQGAARNGKIAIPVDARGETGVLARAFANVIEEVNEKTAALQQEVQEHRRTIAARDHHAERERLFSAAVESSSDAIITTSLDGTVTGWNSAAERLYGYSAAEAAGKNIAILMPPGRLPEAQDILRRIGWGESIEHNETTRLRKDGTPVEVSLSISPIKAPSGATIGISKVARDITDSNKTRLALRQQAEELRRVFETSQDLIMVTDSQGSVVQISPSCAVILGYSPGEMIGRSGEDFIHPDHLENSRQEMRALRRGQRPTIADTRCFHKSGREVWLSWLGVWSQPVRRFFFVGRDMTETRRAQETLRESAQLARGIINTALDAFVQMDDQGTIADWNSQAENIFGWTRDEAVGAKLSDLIIPYAHRDAHTAGLERFLRTGDGVILGRRLEIDAMRRDGKEIKVELSVTALKRRNGFVFNGFIRDLTDKIATEDRIRQSEKMEAVGQLTGGIAHDFNNILTVITGTIEILADAVKDEPQLAAITRMIDEAASRGADLTQHLLAFARKQPLEPQETDVNTLIIDTAKLLQRTLGEHVEIESVFEDESCPAIVDPNQLATAILNLALNARDAMPDGGKLIIETGMVVLDEQYARTHNDVRPGRYAMIAVSDTGTGIPAAILDKVFNPFFTSKGPGKGTGLGLSMVYGFVKQSAGHIMIYSEEGHGTTIKMYLPPASGASLAAGPSHGPTVEGGNETILVVEDDALVRNYVLTQLHSLGYVTLDAGNATEALAIVNAGHPFDLLFTDVIMPGLNGRQLANEMLKIKPELKVLFTSGYTENAIIHHGRLDEGVLLLAKPYRKSDMAIMIRKALGD